MSRSTESKCGMTGVCVCCTPSGLLSYRWSCVPKSMYIRSGAGSMISLFRGNHPALLWPDGVE